MRRLALFVLVLGGGLAILFGVARERDRRRAEEVRTERPAQVPPGDEDAVLRLDAPEGEPQALGGAQVRGYLEYTGHDLELPGRPRSFQLSIEEVVPLAERGLHALRGLRAELFEAETGALRAALSAPRGRARVSLVDNEPRVGRDEPISIEEVELSLLAGTPLAPLHLRTRQLALHLEASRFTGEERVTIEGEGLTAEGVGLDVRSADGFVSLLREGAVEFEAADGDRWRLAATGDGPLRIERTQDEGGRGVRVDVSGGARMEFEGDQGLSLAAEVIVVEGVERDGEQGRRLVVRSAQALTGVVLASGADEFTGETGLFEFDAQGAISRASLRGAPRAAFWLEGGAEEPSRRVDLAGEGPLVVRFYPALELSLDGPARVRLDDLGVDVRASRSVWGRETGADGGLLELSGEVEGTFEGARWVGGELSLRARPGADGAVELAATSPAPSRLEGRDRQGREFVVDAGGELDLVAREAGLAVSSARDAHLELHGEGGFEVEAGRVIDFDGETRRFEAGEGVTYTSGSTQARGERVRSDGEGGVELFGTPDLPAELALGRGVLAGVTRGLARGRRVELSPDAVLAEGAVHLELEGPDGPSVLDCERIEVQSWAVGSDEEESAPRPLSIEADQVRRAELAGSFGRAELAADHLFATAREAAGQGPGARTTLTSIRARGAVEVALTGAGEFSGSGERFSWDVEGGGRLEGAGGVEGAAESDLVRARGRLSATDQPYSLLAAWVAFDTDRLEARRPRLALDPSAPAGTGAGLASASADHMVAGPDGARFEGSAGLAGHLESGRPWELSAETIEVDFADPPPGAGGEGIAGGRVERLAATGGFELASGADLSASGERLLADRRSLHLVGEPARLAVLGLAWESTRIDHDLVDVLVRAEGGSVESIRGPQEERWSMTYRSLRPFPGPDSTILVLRHPRFTGRGTQARAESALIWIDRAEWRRNTAGWLGRVEPAETAPSSSSPAPAPADEEISLFGRFDARGVSHLVTEVYLDGEIELTAAGVRKARMDAAYLDLVDGHGWLEAAEVFIDTSVRGVPQRLAVRADWLRHSADGSLQADQAVITSCLHEEPHFFVSTEDLRLVPTEEGEVGWRVSTRKNSLRFDNGLSFPLPPIRYRADSSGRPLLTRLDLGDSARLGQFARTSLTAGLGVLGAGIARAADVDRERVEGNTHLHASYSGSRGLLLGAGLEATMEDRFWANLYVDAIDDGGADRGIVRSDPDTRSDFRHFLRGRARYLFTEREWLDFVLSEQSDEGVQSEYLEREFLRYEEKDTYLHWRKADDQHFLSGTAGARLDEFRSTVVEQPGVGYYRGLTPIGSWWGSPLLYAAHADLAWLRRMEGSSEVVSPFDPSFDDGLGERDVGRFDTEQRLELPFDLGEGGWKATPFASVRATAWSEDAAEEGAASRGGLFAGVRLASVYFTRHQSGLTHSLTPRLGLRTDVASFEDGGSPVSFDGTDEPFDGLVADAGLRSRWRLPDGAGALTFDLRGSWLPDAQAGEEEIGPVAFLSEYTSKIGGLPVALVHDGRYDIEEEGTVYSRTLFGIQPHEHLHLRLGHHRGEGLDTGEPFEAASVRALWRAGEKWEFEGRQTVSLADDASLNSRLVLRRIGHDLIFELQYGLRSGEGGSSLGISVKPLLGWKPTRGGLLERWKDEND
ncbi:MAG: hypothetical protein QF410_00585 [Planctomycetota bacterium]|nr:hypothetical protein [Planctomycetota bacterium]MDP6762714.1 hypothetical protein [Planctomycetota bacterium]